MKIEKCEDLRPVEGYSQLGGLFTAQAKINAQNEAVNEAAKKGASHIVWRDLDPGWSGTGSFAKAFNCKGEISDHL